MIWVQSEQKNVENQFSHFLPICDSSSCRSCCRCCRQNFIRQFLTVGKVEPLFLDGMTSSPITFGLFSAHVGLARDGVGLGSDSGLKA